MSRDPRQSKKHPGWRPECFSNDCVYGFGPANLLARLHRVNIRCAEPIFGGAHGNAC